MSKKRNNLEVGSKFSYQGKTYVVSDVDVQVYPGHFEKRYLGFSDRRGKRWVDQDDVGTVATPRKAKEWRDKKSFKKGDSFKFPKRKQKAKDAF